MDCKSQQWSVATIQDAIVGPSWLLPNLTAQGKGKRKRTTQNLKSSSRPDVLTVNQGQPAWCLALPDFFGDCHQYDQSNCTHAEHLISLYTSSQTFCCWG
jgi:hypothetical protein